MYCVNKQLQSNVDHDLGAYKFVATSIVFRYLSFLLDCNYLGLNYILAICRTLLFYM